VITSSISGNIVNKGMPLSIYCGSKAAISHMARCLAVEWAPNGIRVNTLSPGYVDTDMNSPTAEERPVMEASVPLGRFGTTEEQAGTVVFLMSDQARFMTGADLVVDGGHSVWA